MHVLDGVSTTLFDGPASVADALGWAGMSPTAGLPAHVGRALSDAVMGGTRPDRPAESLASQVLEWDREVVQRAKVTGEPVCRRARWPGAAPYAVFLSHDVDQIHDRELFRWLGDVNHLRRMLLNGEHGDTVACLKRIARPILRPIDPMQQFETMREIERAHGWHSTFFLLEDRYWARKGGRFRWDDPAFQRISAFLIHEGCELGIHGSAYLHDDPTWWKESQERFAGLYGRSAQGARNHYLTLRVPATWLSQRRAGITYDSTFGYADKLGAPAGFCFPFALVDQHDGDQQVPLIELPVTIMDQTVFRYAALRGEDALAACVGAVETVRQLGGLVTLLWHNNFFAEEEYVEWQDVYVRLLEAMGPDRPWVACGRDIARWWMARRQLRLIAQVTLDDSHRWHVEAGADTEGAAIEVVGADDDAPIECDVEHRIERRGSGTAVVHLPRLDAGTRATLRVGCRR